MAHGGWRFLERRDSVAATGYFKAPNAGAGDSFGNRLALSADGGTLAVGARGEGGFSGAAYVYRRSGSAWSVEAFIKAPVADDESRRDIGGDLFGGALALSADGSVLAVGAPGEDSGYSGVFAPGDPGYHTALNQNNVNPLTGIGCSGTEGCQNGAAYVYRRSAYGHWAIEAFIKAPVYDTFGRFGFALALSRDGSVLAVGAPPRFSNGTAYVYRRSGSAWSVEAILRDPAGVTGVTDRLFGSALALSAGASVLAVGAYGYSEHGDEYDRGDRRGAAYVYRRRGSAWSVEAFLKAPNAGAGDYFGFALALSAAGSTLAVGAPYEDSGYSGVFAPGDTHYAAALADNDSYGSGAAYVYRRSDAGHWAIEAFVKTSLSSAFTFGGHGEAGFGIGVALDADGSTLAVGASLEDSSATGAFVLNRFGSASGARYGDARNSGAAQIYRRHSSGGWTVGNFLKAPNAGAGDFFGFALALSAAGSTLAVGAFTEDGNALPQPVGGRSADIGNAVENSGAVYLY